MTAEEKRERILKRILPGMGITIIYFIFVSGMLSEKMNKADDDYLKITQKGISSASVPNILRQQSKSINQIKALEKQQNDFKKQLSELAGFLSDMVPSNDSSTQLSTILATNNIRVQKEQRELFLEDDLSLALKEIWQWLKPEAESKNEPLDDKQVKQIYVQHLSLKGSYQNMYFALLEIAKGELKAVPVSLSMKASTDTTENSNDLDWELFLWM